MRRMIKIESSSFAALVRNHKKTLNMLAVMQHICQDNNVALSMLPDEVCELINLDPAEIEKQRLRKKRMAQGIILSWILAI